MHIDPPMGIELVPVPQAPPAPGAPPKPDAMKFPGFNLKLRNMHERHAEIATAARRAMNLSNARGGNPCIRDMPHCGFIFVSQTPTDELNFPGGHDLSGKSRYRWEKQTDGTEWGFKVEGADNA